MMIQHSFRVGDVVFSRHQRWRVVSIRPYPACNVVVLAGAAVSNAGRAAHVITPFDEVERAPTSRKIRLVGPRRWRRRCRGLLASHGPADRLQTAHHARIDLMPHQLEPALALVRGLTCRVLVADEVGLGKTIQAGLIAAELRARGVADRILVLTPSGLREQWADELKRRFDLDPAVMDASSIRRRASTLAIGVNPWTTVSIAIASFDYVKRPEVQPALASCRWDLVVVDEAHCAGPGSDRLGAVRAVCAQASYVALLTATPHSGSTSAFDALCRIGAQGGDRLLIFRRSRGQVGASGVRRVHRVLVAASPAERAMHATLTDLAKAVSGETEPSRDAWLTVAVLQKRAFSSAYALARSLLRHPKLGAIDPGDPEAGQQLLLPLVDAGDLDASDEPPVCISPVLRDAAAERRLVNVLAARAAAAARREAKLLYLERLLRRFGRLNERAIVFTEYRDTLLHVRERLSCDCAVLHGGLTREERRLQLERFSSGGCRVLLATDAAGEGLNLHAHCRTVINLELPWNPMRLEQRIGRVDRIGQQKRVHAFHLISRGTGEVRILDHLRAKLARARADVSVADPLGWGDEPDDRLLAEIAAGVESTDHSQSIVSHQPADHPDHVVFAHLEPEAAAEFQRLAAARRLSAAIPFDAESEDCMAIATRRTSTRARLNGRVLAIACAEVSDPFGRTIASRVLPLLATASRNRSRPALSGSALVEPGLAERLAALASAFETHARRFDDEGWHLAMGETHQAFVQARRQRVAAILADLDLRPSRLAQAGLFDRRALGELSEEAAQRAELKDELERSIASASAPADRVLRVALMMAGRW